jgi:CheY-like chemotaxis protein
MRRILVIDDDAMIRALLRTVLEREGYAVVEAANGAEGLQRYQATPMDLIITDLRMPKMDGLELLRALQGVVPTPAVIAVSGDHHTLTQAQLLTPHTFAKPVPLPQLLATVQALVVTAGP